MKTKLLYVSIISILFIYSCNRNDTSCGDLSDVITNYNISDGDKAKIPYIGTDTLVFISDANDTAILIGQGKKRYNKTETYNISGGDCPRNGISNYDNINIDFIGNSTFFSTLNYRIAKTDFAPQTLTGLEIKCNETYRVGSSLQNVFYYLPIEDSIFINKKFVSGGFIDDEKTLLYNPTIGILKIKFSNKTWIKNN